jgi:hypothetical protein
MRSLLVVVADELLVRMGYGRLPFRSTARAAYDLPPQVTRID